MEQKSRAAHIIQRITPTRGQRDKGHSEVHMKNSESVFKNREVTVRAKRDMVGEFVCLKPLLRLDSNILEGKL